MSCTNKRHILEIDELSVSFLQYEREKSTRQVELPVISKLSVSVHEGEIVAVVGSSGSGKSLLAHANFRPFALQCQDVRGHVF